MDELRGRICKYEPRDLTRFGEQDDRPVLSLPTSPFPPPHVRSRLRRRSALPHPARLRERGPPWARVVPGGGGRAPHRRRGRARLRGADVPDDRGGAGGGARRGGGGRGAAARDLRAERALPGEAEREPA